MWNPSEVPIVTLASVTLSNVDQIGIRTTTAAITSF
jgi:hypothetical protein